MLGVLAFLLPLLTWSAFSYLPFLWHPKMLVLDGGGTYLAEGKRYEKEAFREANEKAAAEGAAPRGGRPREPDLPARAARGRARARATAFRPPQNASDYWLHERSAAEPAGDLLGLLLGGV